VRNRGARIKDGDEIVDVKEMGADALQILSKHGR
jgi:hypothetical protein